MHTQRFMGRQVPRWLPVIFFAVMMVSLSASRSAADCNPIPPIITNVPSSITGYCCKTVTYDFHATDMAGDPYIFQLVSGPGRIDQNTGVWIWDTIPASAAGTYTLVVQAIVPPCEGFKPTIPVTVTAITAISSGCGTTSHKTGETVNTQMATDTSNCPASSWSVSRVLGGPACTYSVSPGGQLQFSAGAPDVYVLDVVAYAGDGADTCSHTYIVHGGPGCCVGQRGNVNAAGIVDLSDLSVLIGYLTMPYVVLGCYDAANVNGSGIIDLNDLSMLISYLTGGHMTLPNCS